VASDQPGFFHELKRRHVVRVAIAYALAGWLLVQVATQVFPFFNIPGWAVRLVVVLIVIGFPVAVAFAWVYELTPEGIRRTTPAGTPDARAEYEYRSMRHKLYAIIVVVLVLAVALRAWRLFAVRHARAPAPIAAAAASSPDEVKRNPGTASAIVPDSTAAAVASGLPGASGASGVAIPTKSVAVLPFANESGNKDQQFFSDGLSEDLITALSQFAGLKVISRNSAFQFRDSKDTSAQIGKLLGVAHLLEGSVQRAGDEVRITATLVNAADGSIVWSRRYDKPYKDLFALQDAITTAVASALKAKLLTAPGAVVQSDRPPSGNLDAYAAYLHGRGEMLQGTELGYRRAIANYGQAIRLDSRYARAYAAQAFARAQLGAIFLGGGAQQRVYDEARHAIDKSLQLDPDLAAAYAARSYLETYGEFDWHHGLSDAQQAVRLAPDDSNAKLQLVGVLATLGQVKHAAALTNADLSLDPRNSNSYFDLSWYYLALGRSKAAETAVRTAIAIEPQAAQGHELWAIIEVERGDAGAALAAAQKEPDGSWRQIALAFALQIGPDRKAADAALKKLIQDQSGVAGYQIAEIYALRGDADGTFKWLDRAWTDRDGGISYLLMDPLILRYHNDPRFAPLCKKVGLPATTDAVAMKL
jgi:TolB-like protein